MSTDYILAICDSNVPLLHHPVIQSSSSGCLLMAAPINADVLSSRPQPTELLWTLLSTPCTKLQCYIHGRLCCNDTYMEHYAKMLHKWNILLQCYIHGALALFFIIGSVCLLNRSTLLFRVNIDHTGWFFNWPPPKKLKYVKPRLGVSTLT